MTEPSINPGLLRRVDCKRRAPVRLQVDGAAVTALAGDTLLAAILTNGTRLRESEFCDGARAGFCMMGVCQDCWVTAESGERMRACTTPVEDGMSVTTGTAWLTKP